MDRSVVTIERMRSFVRVAERGSLSAVARELGVGQSTVTRHLAELEGALGVALLHRTTRSMTLTAEGSRHYEQACTILRLIDEAVDDARDAGTGVRGRIRISCTAALGVRHVARLLFEFQDRHPDIDIDLSLSDARIDLVREATDIAIRLGPLADSTLQCRKIGPSRRILAASPAYLAEAGRPEDPEALARHRMIRMSNVAGSDRLVLHGPDGDTRSLPSAGHLRLDHGLAAREALLCGRGIAATHLWLVDDLLADGRLEQVLPDFRPAPVPLTLLFVPGRTRIRRVRLLVDALATSLATLPGFRDPGEMSGRSGDAAPEVPKM